MKFFADTADLKQIQEINKWFPLDGVTTNPTLVAKTGQDHLNLIRSLTEELEGPLSAEVISTSAEEMVKEGKELSQISDQVVVKLPLTKDGLLACKKLKEKNIRTNLTLCFSALQALSAGLAGADFVSIFVGRLDDTGGNGMEVVSQVLSIFAQYQIKTQVIVASVRNVFHILSSAEMGADIVTIPPHLFSQIVKHPLTDTGLAQFLESARSAKKKTGKRNDLK